MTHKHTPKQQDVARLTQCHGQKQKLGAMECEIMTLNMVTGCQRDTIGCVRFAERKKMIFCWNQPSAQLEEQTAAPLSKSLSYFTEKCSPQERQ